MKAERLKQIEEIYHAALELSPNRREKFFGEVCGADKDLRREVESLLAFDETAEEFIDAPPASLAAAMFVERENKPDLTGKEIGHYKIRQLLGKGGMGEVYLAADTRLDRQVALKILPPEFAENKDRMNRFVREAKAASALNHPNIITIYEIGESEGTHFIAAEFIDGKTLSEYVKSRPLNYKSALEIAVQIAFALEEAHSAGIVHRDIKPDNVMVRSNGLTKILDFGIAKLVEMRNAERGTRNEEDGILIQFDSDTPHSTSPGMIIGTASYMSPEQAKGKAIDARADIFSFGVLLYEMIAGRLPFEGETALEMIGAILHKEPLPLDANVPKEIAEIIHKCLRKDRAERYQTISDIGGDLKQAERNLEIERSTYRAAVPNRQPNETPIPRTATADESPQTITNQIISRRPKIHYLSIGLMILLIAGGGFFGYKYLAPTERIESIAVMPFVNESGNQDAEYLSDGMTETLIGSLSQVPNLNVKARSSVFRYKGKTIDEQTIGKELNVQAVLNGRITERGDQITLNLELVDAATENVIWSQQYNRRQSDLVSLQSQIARDVAEKLRSKISGAEAVRIAKTSTTDPDAYQAYLKGRFYWNRRTTENIYKAVEQFKYAADRDPNYALAYAGLADCYAVLRDYAAVPSSEMNPQVKEYAERALSLDPQLAEPHASMAKFYENLRQWTDAENEFKRAIELNPNYATAYHWYSILLRDLGRFDESLVMIKRAHELDPLSSVISLNVSQVYQAQKNYDASIENTLKILELDPNYSGAYNNLGLAYIKTGRGAEAVADFEKAVELAKRADVVLRNLGYAYGAVGRRAEALAIAKELEEKYAKKQAIGQYIATVYAGLGDKDKVFEWLEKDLQNNENIAGIRWSPQFELIFDDPRYKDLLKRMNLPE